jgi:ribosomal protein S13
VGVGRKLELQITSNIKQWKEKQCGDMFTKLNIKRVDKISKYKCLRRERDLDIAGETVTDKVMDSTE